MKKQDYIEVIEKLNLEMMRLYNTRYYRKYRDKILFRSLMKSHKYKLAYILVSNSLKSKLHSFFKIKNKNKSNESVLFDFKDKNKFEKNKKIVVYTCILDNYDILYSPLIDTDNTNYVVFSDNKNITKNTESWHYRKIPEYIKKKCKNNNTLINRYIKMHPHELFENYDLALYIDGSVRIISDISDLFSSTNNKTGLAMHHHPKRKDIYEEAKACIKSSLGNKKAIKNLINNYKKEGFPENFGLFEATIIAIDLKNKNSYEIMNYWWKNFIASETFRDQLIFTYVLWKMNYNFDDIGVLGNNISLNPKFRRSVHNYSKKL